jgi:UDP-N-acetylmuramoyl-tripeptide--D-alanyl-D-alanine ligase
MPKFIPEHVESWTGGLWGVRPEGLNGVSIDTRRLEPGALFVALKGTRCDGHNYVADAFAKGAAGAVVCSDWRGLNDERMPLLRVGDTLHALRAMARGYRDRVDPLLIGITGSAGKSTVKGLTAAILSPAMRTAATLGNWNNTIGLPLSLLAMAEDTEAGVFEVGTNHPGEIADLCGILRPSWGVVTNVGPVHTEFFESLDAIATEKAALPAGLPADGVAFINADDDYCQVFECAARAACVTVSLRGRADYTADPDGAAKPTFRVYEHGSGESAVLPRVLPGTYNLTNVLLAVAVGRRAGVAWDTICSAIRTYRPLPMRWQIDDLAGRHIVNDAYNANPMSMRAAIRAFVDEPCEGGKWLVLGGMLELGSDEAALHRELGAWLTKWNWAGVVTVGPRGDWIADGIEQAGEGYEAAVFRCADADAAAHRLGSEVGRGDAVFLKASRGMQLESVIQRIKEDRTWSA